MDSGGSSPLFYSGKVMVRVQTRSSRAALWDTTQVPAGGLAEEEIPYLGLGDQIQHGGALIAEEELHRGMEGAGQAEPLELAAGKCGNRLEYIIPREYEGGKHIADLPLRQGGVGVCDFLKNGLAFV